MLSAIKAGTMPPAPRAALSGEDLAKLQSWRDGQTPAAATSEPDPKGAPVTQIVAAQTLATYKAALPKVGWPRLAKLLASPSTLFWDKATLPPAYQDTVGDGSSLPFGARLNSEGKSLIVQEGKKLFSDDGTTWAYPFGHTAGADASPDIFIVDFMALPEVNGAQLPVAYEVESTTVSSLPVKRWNWSFPRGTVVGEIIMIKDGSSLLTTELRVRERFGDRWATNVFRPFPTAAVLAATVKAKRPQWQSTPALSSLVAALAKPTLTAKHKGSPAFSDLVVLDGSVDAPLPDFGDDALVRELLGTTTFVAAYGTVWKTDGTAKAFGPTGPTAGLSVVPSGFDTGLLEVRETTCEKCHNQGGYFIGDLVDQAILYGDIWGVDRIFSFHPFEPSRIDASGAENRSVRAPFAQIVQPYNPNKHPSSRYSFYRPMR